MGDVYDALNRARGGPAASPAAPVAESERGSLPIQEVEAAAATAPTEAAATVTAPAVPAQPVAAAQERAQSESTRQRQEQAAAMSGHGDPSRNGYSVEVVVHHDRGSLVTEQYRAIRTQIIARCRSRRLQTHAITSAAPEEGKSLTTVNLGVAFAEIRTQRILLLEGDVRRPSFHRYFGRQAERGLLQLLRGETDDIDSVLQPTAYDNLQYLAAGGQEPIHSTQLLSSPRMAQVLDRLKDRYDFIFLDTPPVVSVTDPCILGAMCDAVLMVVRLNKTPSEVIERAKRLLRAANCEVSGVILTHQQPDVARYVHRYSSHYRYYTNG